MQHHASGTPHIPIIIGGQGPKRTPALAARFADEYNTGFVNMDFGAEQFTRVRAACAAAGREEDDLTYSSAQVVCCGRTDAEVAARAEAIGREVDELRENGLAGSPAEIVDKLGAWAEAGAERVYLQVLDLQDLDHVTLIGSEVLSQVR